MSYVLGLDLGSSSLKGVLMDETGRFVLEKTSHYPMSSPKAGYSEQNPESWIDACEIILRSMMEDLPDFGSRLVGVSFSGQMHSLVALDQENKPVYPAILWNDVRTTKQCQEITEVLGTSLLDITKNRALEGFTLPKILWLRENQPEVWKKVTTIMLPKDYLRYWLTGELHTEYSDAAGTLLMDVENKVWSSDILGTFDLSENLLPPLVSSLSHVGKIKAGICKRFRIKREVKVFAGGADNACAALGAGLLSDETGLVSIGTSGVFCSVENEIRDYAGRIHFFNHVLPESYYAMGVTLAAGNSLQWFKETFAKDQSFEELLSGIDEIPIGCNGLMFTPYIVGERTPYFDSKVRGSFIGIDTSHELKNFVRAVLEGITFSLKQSQILLENEKGHRFKKVISVGGGSKNKTWLQMQADIFQVPISTLKTEQGPGLGAAMLAAMGCGLFSSVEEAIEKAIVYEEIIKPIEKNSEAYERFYRIYQEVYPQTKLICHKLIKTI